MDKALNDMISIISLKQQKYNQTHKIFAPSNIKYQT